jgi:hypothetical protein
MLVVQVLGIFSSSRMFCLCDGVTTRIWGNIPAWVIFRSLEVLSSQLVVVISNRSTFKQNGFKKPMVYCTCLFGLILQVSCRFYFCKSPFWT